MSFGLPIPFYGANSYVAASSSSYTGGRVIILPFGSSTAHYSTNGDTWTSATIQSGSWYSADWSHERKRYVAVAEDNKISYSSDGISWTASTNLGTGHHGVRWVPTINLFIAGSDVASNGIIYSSDGISWTATSASTGRCEEVAYNDNIIVSVGINGIMTSTDGLTWTNRTATSSGGWHAVGWSPQRGYFMAGAVTGEYATSSDGIIWSYNTSSENFRTIVWSPTLDLFCAASYTRKMCYSSGGTWTQSSSSNAGWWDVKWEPEYNRFVAIALTTLTTKAYWSSDAKTWTASTTTLPAQARTVVSYAPGLGTDF